MKVFLLERREPEYNDIDAIAVKAETKEEARRLVYEDLKKAEIEELKASDFLTSEKSVCHEIKLSDKGVFMISYSN
jgi:ABC-type lipoprotein release transport system permease subunit